MTSSLLTDLDAGASAALLSRPGVSAGAVSAARRSLRGLLSADADDGAVAAATLTLDALPASAGAADLLAWMQQLTARPSGEPGSPAASAPVVALGLTQGLWGDLGLG